MHFWPPLDAVVETPALLGLPRVARYHTILSPRKFLVVDKSIMCSTKSAWICMQHARQRFGRVLIKRFKRLARQKAETALISCSSSARPSSKPFHTKFQCRHWWPLQLQTQLYPQAGDIDRHDKFHHSKVKTNHLTTITIQGRWSHRCKLVPLRVISIHTPQR